MKEAIAILGGGHGAHAMAGDLASRGFSVNMFEIPSFRAACERSSTPRPSKCPASSTAASSSAKSPATSTSADDLGLAGMSLEQIKTTVKTGQPDAARQR